MPLTKAEKAFMVGLNEGLACPEGYDLLTEDDIVECDICHRLIVFWHFHTLSPPQTKDEEESECVGSGLDCCNVCRYRFTQAVASERKKKGHNSATPFAITLAAVHRNGKGRGVRMSSNLRFYCVGMAGKKSLQGKSAQFMNKMLSQEKNPSTVLPSELFAFTEDCPVVLKRLPASSQKGAESNSDSKVADGNGDRRNTEQKSESKKDVVAAAKTARATRSEVTGASDKLETEEVASKRSRTETAKSYRAVNNKGRDEEVRKDVASSNLASISNSGVDRGVPRSWAAPVFFDDDDEDCAAPSENGAEGAVDSPQNTRVTVVGEKLVPIQEADTSVAEDAALSFEGPATSEAVKQHTEEENVPNTLGTTTTAVPAEASDDEDAPLATLLTSQVSMIAVTDTTPEPRASTTTRKARSLSSAALASAARSDLLQEEAHAAMNDDAGEREPALRHSQSTSCSRGAGRKSKEAPVSESPVSALAMPPTPLAVLDEASTPLPALSLEAAPEMLGVGAAQESLAYEEAPTDNACRQSADVFNQATALETMGVEQQTATQHESTAQSAEGVGERTDVLAHCVSAGGDSSRGFADTDRLESSRMEELLSFFDSLIPQFGMPAAPEPDECGTNFILHEGGLPSSSRVEAEEPYVMIDEEGAIAGLRLSGDKAVSVEWVPTPPSCISSSVSSADNDAFFGALVIADRSNYLPLYRVSLQEDGSIASIRCLYTVMLGKRQPSGLEWVQIPDIHSPSSNRMGACSIIRDNSVFTMMLPYTVTEGEDDDNADDEEMALRPAPAISAEVVGYTSVDAPVICAKWSPSVRNLDDLRLFVHTITGFVHVFRHRREEDVSMVEAVQNTTDKMRMLPECVIPAPGLVGPCPTPLSSFATMSVGYVRGKLYAAWGNGSVLMAATGFPEGVLSAQAGGRVEPSVVKHLVGDGGAHISVVCVTEGGIAVGTKRGDILMIGAKGNSSSPFVEECVSEPLGVSVTLLQPMSILCVTNALPSTRRLLLATSAGQLLRLTRTSMNTFASIMEMVCTPSPAADRDTDVDLRTAFDLVPDENHRLSLLNVAMASRPDMLKETAEVRWRVRPVLCAHSLALGMCPEGSVVVFGFDPTLS